MRFESQSFDPGSRSVSVVVIDAGSEQEARARLESQGRKVLSIKPAPSQAGRAVQAELALLCRELRALLQAGLSVVEALDALAAAAGPQSLYESLLVRLREGKALSTAMADLGDFPPLLVASVRASERTSDLPHALDAYIRFDDMVGALRRKIVSAALYPMLVVGLGSVIAVFLLMVVVPRFAKLYGESQGQVSWATRALLAFSAQLALRPWLVPSAIVVILGGLVWLARGDRPRRVLAWILARVSLLNNQVEHFERARLFEAMALLIRGGYSLHEALGVCQSLATQPARSARLAMVSTRIEHGTAASQAFAAGGLTDAVTERLMRAGERGGEFDRVLGAIAERHRVAFETFVDRATRVVEPVLLLGVALLVGGMVVLLYMPVFDIAASVQ